MILYYSVHVYIRIETLSTRPVHLQGLLDASEDTFLSVPICLLTMTVFGSASAAHMALARQKKAMEAEHRWIRDANIGKGAHSKDSEIQR